MPTRHVGRDLDVEETRPVARVSIEDCLDYIENRFALVAVASDRTRNLMDGAETLLRSKNKEAVTALREIAEGLVVAKPTTAENVDPKSQTPGHAR